MGVEEQNDDNGKPNQSCRQEPNLSTCKFHRKMVLAANTCTKDTPKGCVWVGVSRDWGIHIIVGLLLVVTSFSQNGLCMKAAGPTPSSLQRQQHPMLGIKHEANGAYHKHFR